MTFKCNIVISQNLHCKNSARNNQNSTRYVKSFETMIELISCRKDDTTMEFFLIFAGKELYSWGNDG